VVKTRLAFEVTREVAEAFPVGEWFGELTPFNDPYLVATALAQALSVRETGGWPRSFATSPPRSWLTSSQPARTRRRW
jgi:hypothetical protein